MHAAMHIGVFGFHKIAHGVEHRLRLLRRGRIVQIDELLAVHHTRQNGKIAPQRLRVEGGFEFRLNAHGALPSDANAASTLSHSAAWTVSSAKPCIASSRKA